MYRFHGNDPAKRTTEKKLRKLAQQQTMTQADGNDTPLGTLAKQTERQADLQQPFIMISGKGADIASHIKKE